MMRRLLLMILLTSNIFAMQLSQQFSVTNPSFGRTHFISGYTKQIPHIKSTTSFDPPVTNYIELGSSAHLINPNRHTQSFFTTVHDIPSIISAILDQAKSSISVAAFALTDPVIAQKLIEAHEKGIKVSIIMDAGNMKLSYSKAQKLIDNGIDVWRYDPTLRADYKKTPYEPYMHRKCYIIDDEVVITGSANVTKAGLKNNAEDINILRCKESVAEHCQEFQRLLHLCNSCTKKI